MTLLITTAHDRSSMQCKFRFHGAPIHFMGAYRMLAQIKYLGLALAIITGLSGGAAANDGNDGIPSTMDAEKRTQVLEWVIETASRKYVDPVMGQTLADHVADRRRAGAYATLGDTEDFVFTLEQDLRKVSGDKHVGIWAERLEDALAEDLDYTPADEDYVAHLRRTNFGYVKVEILPGNIAYLRIDEFAHSALGGPTTVAVMSAIGNADAVIIDLRWNGGGAGMVGAVSGYFFAEPTLLNEGWDRGTGKTEQVWTPEYLPGPSLADVPLYVLISGQTFSAAEAFTYALKHLGRATVVGARSKGGAHGVSFYRLMLEDMAIAMMVPTWKPINPVTGSNWEGVGVAPDIEASPVVALEVAYNAAVDGLLETTFDDETRTRLLWSRDEFTASRRPVALTTAMLSEYAGSYENRSFVAGEDNVLYYQSEPGSRYMLSPLGNDLFKVEGFEGRRFRFERDGQGKVCRVVSLKVEGASVTRKRSTAQPFAPSAPG